MTKDIELSFINETTIIVKDATAKSRFDSKQFGAVHSDRVYFQHLDDNNYVVFVTGFAKDDVTKIYIQPFLPDRDLKSSDFKLKWLINNEQDYHLPLSEITTPSSERLVGNGNVWRYGNDNTYGREGGCIYYKFEFLNGLKLRLPTSDTIDTFILNKISNQTAYDTGVGLYFTFVIDGEPIRASKFILISNSEVFPPCLPTTGKIRAKIRLTSRMDSFVRAMHGIEQPIKDVAMAVKMFTVADKYKVDPLLEQAKTFVKANLNCTNVINAIVLAYQLNLTDIQETALNYVLNCGKPLAELDGHDQVPQEVAVKLFQTVYQKMVENVQK